MVLKKFLNMNLLLACVWSFNFEIDMSLVVEAFVTQFLKFSSKAAALDIQH